MADLTTATIGGGSAILVAANRNAVSAADGVQPEITDIDFVGTKPLTILLIDFVADATAEVGANETMQAVFEIIQKYATMVVRGDLFDGGTQMAVLVETSNETADWNGDDSETTLAANIQNEVQALGADYGNNDFGADSITVTVKTSLNIS